MITKLVQCEKCLKEDVCDSIKDTYKNLINDISEHAVKDNKNISVVIKCERFVEQKILTRYPGV